MTMKLWYKGYKEKEKGDNLWAQICELSWAGRDETSEKVPNKKTTKKETKRAWYFKKQNKICGCF